MTRPAPLRLTRSWSRRAYWCTPSDWYLHFTRHADRARAIYTAWEKHYGDSK